MEMFNKENPPSREKIDESILESANRAIQTLGVTILADDIIVLPQEDIFKLDHKPIHKLMAEGLRLSTTSQPDSVNKVTIDNSYGTSLQALNIPGYTNPETDEGLIFFPQNYLQIAINDNKNAGHVGKFNPLIEPFAKAQCTFLLIHEKIHSVSARKIVSVQDYKDDMFMSDLAKRGICALLGNLRTQLPDYFNLDATQLTIERTYSEIFSALQERGVALFSGGMVQFWLDGSLMGYYGIGLDEALNDLVTRNNKDITKSLQQDSIKELKKSIEHMCLVGMATDEYLNLEVPPKEVIKVLEKLDRIPKGKRRPISILTLLRNEPILLQLKQAGVTVADIPTVYPEEYFVFLEG